MLSSTIFFSIIEMSMLTSSPKSYDLDLVVEQVERGRSKQRSNSSHQAQHRSVSSPAKVRTFFHDEVLEGSSKQVKDKPSASSTKSKVDDKGKK